MGSDTGLPGDGPVLDSAVFDALADAAGNEAAYDRSISEQLVPCADGQFECLAGGSARHCVAGTWVTLGSCPLGCDESAKACYVPSNVPPDTMTGGSGDLDTTGKPSVTIDSDTGEITGIRAAGIGLDPTSGIHYNQQAQQGPGLGVFSSKKLVIPQGVTVEVVGSRALVLLASDSVSIQGTINLVGAGQSAGPGGYAGGDPGQPGQGSCGGKVGQGDFNGESCGSGSGGGGHGADGGAGGDSTCAPPRNHPGGQGGASTCGSPTLIPLVGGSGGGGGAPLAGASGPAPGPGTGGGGGGAIQISAGTSIAIGPGGINVGGAGGGTSTSSGGAGGGAGGAILVEAPAVTLLADGFLAANGGGGGGGDCH